MFRFAQHDRRREPPHSERFRSSFAGSDTDRFFHLGHKDFTVSDFSGLGLFQNRLDCTLRAIVADHDLEFDFWKKIHRVLGAAINLAVPLLPANPFTSLRVIPSTPAAINSSRTGSALNGLMMASIFFTAAN